MEATINTYHSLEDYPPVLQARHVKEILGISGAKAYEVMNSQRCPTIRMGKRMVVIRDSFIKYLFANEGDDLLMNTQSTNRSHNKSLKRSFLTVFFVQSMFNLCSRNVQESCS